MKKYKVGDEILLKGKVVEVFIHNYEKQEADNEQITIN